MAFNRRWENSYKGKNLLLQSLFDVADRLHMTNTYISEQLKAIDKDVRASDGTVSAWRRGETNPCGKTPEVIGKFLERYKDIVPEQTTIPETATLIDRQPPKDKRDGEVLIYRNDTPWRTERPKPKGNTVIHKLLEQFGEEVITKAILGTLTKDQLIEFIQNGGMK